MTILSRNLNLNLDMNMNLIMIMVMVIFKTALMIMILILILSLIMTFLSYFNAQDTTLTSTIDTSAQQTSLTGSVAGFSGSLGAALTAVQNSRSNLNFFEVSERNCKYHNIKT